MTDWFLKCIPYSILELWTLTFTRRLLLCSCRWNLNHTHFDVVPLKSLKKNYTGKFKCLYSYSVSAKKAINREKCENYKSNQDCHGAGDNTTVVIFHKIRLNITIFFALSIRTVVGWRGAKIIHFELFRTPTLTPESDRYFFNFFVFGKIYDFIKSVFGRQIIAFLFLLSFQSFHNG